ncbi:hypothetical protein EON83_05730 [bacterium]|nr:MAG: hypothetical protein EON83_05730 [bacterium]
MIKFSRESRNSVVLSLDKEGLYQLKAALEVASQGEPALVNVELSGRVVGKRWSVDTQSCPCFIFHISPFEPEKMDWDWESKTLKLNIDTETIEITIERLSIAAEQGDFYPTEWLTLDVQKRREGDLICIKLISP